MTMKNGVRNIKRASITAVFQDSADTSIFTTEESVTVGTPTEPKAVGVLLATRQANTTWIGSMPSATRIPAGIATAVPNPAMPSMKFPNPQPIKSRSTLWSMETPESMLLMRSIAPVSSVRL